MRFQLAPRSMTLDDLELIAKWLPAHSTHIVAYIHQRKRMIFCTRYMPSLSNFEFSRNFTWFLRFGSQHRLNKCREPYRQRQNC